MANGKISFDMFCKLANSFTYVFPSTNYSKKKSKIYLKEFMIPMKNAI